MLDPKVYRQHLTDTATALEKRGFDLDVDTIQSLEKKRKQLQVDTQELQNERNLRSKNIGKAKAAGEDIAPLLAEVQGLGDKLKQAEQSLEQIQAQLQAILINVPNLLHESVPEGNDESENREVSVWGEPTKFDFPVKDHCDIGTDLGLLDFEMAAKLTGSRFVVMYGDLVRLHRALIQYMINTHIDEHGYEEIYVPYIVNSDSLFGTGQLPKFAEDQFALEGEQN